MKKIILNFFVVLLSATAVGQSVIPFCGTRTYKDELDARTDLSEGEKATLLQAFEVSQEAFNKYISSPGLKSADTTLVIPMVFHILHQYGPENIPNKTVYATINLLNREYNKKNNPVNNVVPPFNQWIGNANIEFRLATIDPNGNCTNGIIRHADPLAFCNSLDCNKAAKTKFRWPREKYMNMLIVGSIQSSGGGITQGFSHFPFSPYSEADSIDSNAMIWSVLPTDLNDQGGVNTSVTTHEVGHWLGLYHTWGKTDNVADQNNCNDDDDVHDTPNCIGLRSVCNLSANTCGEGQPNDTIDNTQNFMDYSHCYAMFTEGQAARMRGVLTNIPHRKGLATLDNLIAVGANYTTRPTALCQADFTANLNYEQEVICPGASVSFSDLSFHTVTTRKWTFEGGTPATGSDSIVSVTYALPGDYSVTLEVSDGLSTQTTTKTKIIHVIPGAALGTSYTQDFEAIDLNNSTDFEVNNPDGDATFEISNAAGDGSQKSLFIHNFITPVRKRSDEIVSNTVDLSGKSKPTLDFRYAFAGRKDSITADELDVYVSTDCGISWNKRKVIKGNTLKTAPDSNSEFVPDPTNWKSATVSLSGYAKSSVRFKIEFISDGGNNVYIDNLNLYDANSISENMISSSVELSPNPANVSSELSFVLINDQDVEINLNDLTGRRISTIKKERMPQGENSLQIPLNGLRSGIYLVSLHTSTGSITKKLVVQ